MNDPRELPEWLQTELDEHDRSNRLAQLGTAALVTLTGTAVIVAASLAMAHAFAWLAR